MVSLATKTEEVNMGEIKSVINVNMGGKADGGIGIPSSGTGILNSIGLGSIGKMVLLLEALCAGMNVLTGSIRVLLKSVGMIVKPLADIIAPTILAIAMILRPIGIIFNAMMKPYYQKAMEAMKAGGILLGQSIEARKMGDTELSNKFAMESISAFNLGFSTMIKPFSDSILVGFSSILSGTFDLMSTLPGVGWMFKDLSNSVRTTTNDIMNFSNKALDEAVTNSIGNATDAITIMRNKMETEKAGLVSAFAEMIKEMRDSIRSPGRSVYEAFSLGAGIPQISYTRGSETKSPYSENYGVCGIFTGESV